MLQGMDHLDDPWFTEGNAPDFRFKHSTPPERFERLRLVPLPANSYEISGIAGILALEASQHQQWHY